MLCGKCVDALGHQRSAVLLSSGACDNCTAPAPVWVFSEPRVLERSAPVALELDGDRMRWILYVLVWGALLILVARELGR